MPVLQVVFRPRIREVRLVASTAVFATLAAAARHGDAILPCDEPGGGGQDEVDLRDPHLDAELALPVVSIQPTADPLTAVALRVMSPGLVIIGGHERLELLARDFDQLSKADPGEQLLAEWFPGHAYLIATSVPTAFTVTDSPV